jgi:hypothetical protein
MNCLWILNPRKTLLLIGVDLLDVDLPYLLNVFVISLDEWLLHFDLSSENQELVVKGWVTELAIHKLENSLEAVLHLWLLYEGVDYLQIDVLGEFLDGMLD